MPSTEAIERTKDAAAEQSDESARASGLFATVELWKPVPDGSREVPPGGLCPKCRSLHVHRSRTRSALERVLRAFTPLRPFRCTACAWRGWVVPVASQGPLRELPPLPSGRRRSHARTASGRRISSPRELARARARRHVTLAMLLAGLATASMLYCQHEPDAPVALP